MTNMVFQQPHMLWQQIENHQSNISESLDVIFKRYVIYDKGKTMKNKYTQQGVRGIFVGIPGDSAGWLFYVPDARQTYVSLDAIFNEDFTSPLSMPDLPFQGAIRLKSIKGSIKNKHHEDIIEHTGAPNS